MFYKKYVYCWKIALKYIYILYMKVLYVDNLTVKNLVRRRKMD